VENGVVWGSEWSPKVTENSAIQYSTYKFLLAFRSNYVSILLCFKNRRFEPTPPIFGTPLGVTPWNFS